MRMTRRSAMTTGLAAVALLSPRQAAAEFAPRPGAWRRFEVTTRVALPSGGAAARAWLPAPAVDQPGWARSGPVRWTTNASSAALVTDPSNGARFLHASWDAGGPAPALDLVFEASARDRTVDLARPGDPAPLSKAEHARWTAPTALIPTDGIVRETSDRITAGTEDDLAKARRLYDWIVEETARDPEVRGCGLGDVASMLRIGDLTGKCADLNALFVGLARAAGIPARDVYGLRVAPSAFGYASLGARSADVTKAQHCRAEIHLERFGWVPADPADVRKVMLEEPPGDLALDDPKVAAARAALFGAWEGNWVALNFAHDVELPGAVAGPLPFLMYPEAEVAGTRLDALEPEAFAYTIEVRELAA